MLLLLEIMQLNTLSVLNLCNNKMYTRMTNYGELYKHINVKDKYILEKPDDSGISLYPIRTKENVCKAENMILRLRHIRTNKTIMTTIRYYDRHRNIFKNYIIIY